MFDMQSNSTTFPEPLGKVRPNIPSFPTVYSAKMAVNVTLLCPAQAFPKPSYRYCSVIL